MNTQIHYLYRDAANYKRGNTTVVEGEIRFEDVKDCLDGGMFFIASQVGLEDPQERIDDLDLSEDGDDHVWCELEAGDFTPTMDEPDAEVDAETLIANFKEAKDAWDTESAMLRLG